MFWAFVLSEFLSFPSLRQWGYRFGVHDAFLSLSVCSSIFSPVFAQRLTVGLNRPPHCIQRGSHSLWVPCGAWQKQVPQAAGKNHDYIDNSLFSPEESWEFSHSVAVESQGGWALVVGKCRKVSLSLRRASSSFLPAGACCILLTGFWNILKDNLVYYCHLLP